MLNPTTANEAANETTSSQRLAELANTSIELARIVAANIATPPQLLQKLSKRKDIAIKIAVASNPNASTHVLFRLGIDFPEEVLNNPIFQLLLLENPNLLVTIPLKTLASFLISPNVPIYFMDWVINNRLNDNLLLIAIATNSKSPKNILNQILSQPSPSNIPINQAIEAASLHVNIAGEMTKGWDETALFAIREGKFLNKNPQQEKLLNQLHITPKLDQIQKPQFYRNAIYKFPGYISSKVANLIKSIFIELIQALKIRKVQFALLIFILIPSPFKVFIILITFIILFSGLFGGLFGLLCGALIIGLISFVSYYSIIIFSWIRFIHVQGKLSIQKYTFYQHHKNNLKTNQNYRNEWRKVNDIEITKITLSELANSPWLYIREALIKHPYTDSQILSILANAESKYLSTSLLLKIIKHQKVTPKILAKIATYSNNEVVIAVAENIKTPISTLTTLFKKNQNIEKIYTNSIKNILAKNSEIAGKILVKFVKSTQPSIPKLYLLLHPIAPTYFLLKHSFSLDWRERYAVAKNPNTPQHIREKLREDANRIVRATARANL
jgi:hypothetical protein